VGGAEFGEPVEMAGCLFHGDELVFGEIEGIALAQREDEFDLAGADHVGDLHQVEQTVQGGAEHDGGEGDGVSGVAEGVHAGQDLVVVAAYSAEDFAGPVESDVGELDLSGELGCLIHSPGGVGRQADDEAVEGIHHIDEIRRRSGSPPDRKTRCTPARLVDMVASWARLGSFICIVSLHGLTSGSWPHPAS
jgi:hypothetical protein